MKPSALLKSARKLAQETENWIDYHNALFGIEGIITNACPDHQARVRFSETPEYEEIMKMLREKGEDPTGILAGKKGDKILLRLPKSLHSALKIKAKQEKISLNALVVKMLSENFSKTILNP